MIRIYEALSFLTEPLTLSMLTLLIILVGGTVMNRFLHIAILLLSCLVASNALAANPDTGPGCGLGKLAWAEYRGQKEILPQMMQATTNTSTGSQTSGISMGTSGCTNDGKVLAHEKTNVFMNAMFENLEQEMAQGRGEHLTSLATILGIPPDRHSEFFALCQHAYESSILNGESTPAALLNAVHSAMATNQVFAQSSQSDQ